MNIKVLINSCQQLNLKNKQAEQKQGHRYDDHLEFYQLRGARR